MLSQYPANALKLSNWPYSPRPFSSKVLLPVWHQKVHYFLLRKSSASTFVNSVGIAKFHPTAGSNTPRLSLCACITHPKPNMCGFPLKCTMNEGFIIMSAQNRACTAASIWLVTCNSSKTSQFDSNHRPEPQACQVGLGRGTQDGLFSLKVI